MQASQNAVRVHEARRAPRCATCRRMPPFGTLQLGRPKLHELTCVLVEEDEAHRWVEAVDDRKRKCGPLAHLTHILSLAKHVNDIYADKVVAGSCCPCVEGAGLTHSQQHTA